MASPGAAIERLDKAMANVVRIDDVASGNTALRGRTGDVDQTAALSGEPGWCGRCAAGPDALREAFDQSARFVGARGVETHTDAESAVDTADGQGCRRAGGCGVRGEWRP